MRLAYSPLARPVVNGTGSFDLGALAKVVGGCDPWWRGTRLGGIWEVPWSGIMPLPCVHAASKG